MDVILLGRDEMEHSDLSLLLVICSDNHYFSLLSGRWRLKVMKWTKLKWWNNTKKGIFRTENPHFGIKKGDGINVLKLSILSSLLLVHKLILPFDDKVANSLELGSATFWAKKRQKEPQIFFTENATILIKGATI